MKSLSFISIFIVAIYSISFSATKQIVASKDNTMYEGTLNSNGVGDHFFAGKAGEELKGAMRRSLLMFDLSSIPVEAKILRVTLRLHMSRTKTTTGRLVSLHSLAQNWGEEDSHASGEEGGGASASVGDATWNFAYMRAFQWKNPGGDFSAGASGTQTVGATGYYTWGSTEGMVSDVQTWVSTPSLNFGWLIKGDESSMSTAKRFDSRQNSVSEYRPLLEIEYEAPDVHISEVFQFPEKEGFPGEFVEIFNAGKIEQKLDGWMLFQPNLQLLTNLNEKSLLNGDLILEPGEYAVIGRGSADEFKKLWGFLPDTYFSEGNSSDAGAPQISDGAYWELWTYQESIKDRFGNARTFRFSSSRNHYTRIDYPNSGMEAIHWLADTKWGNPGTDNLAPVANNDNTDVDEDGQVKINVLGNDSDLDGNLDGSTVDITVDPTKGKITAINAKSGEVTYEPNKDYHGADQFRYTVRDDKKKLSNQATVSIYVRSVNDPPVISKLPILEFNEDQMLILPLVSLFDYVEDPDTPDGELDLKLSGGKNVIIDSDGSNATLTSQLNWFGEDTILLEVSDGESSDKADLYVVVHSINDIPEISGLPKSIALNADSTKSLMLWDFVSDVETSDKNLKYSFAKTSDSLNLDFEAASGKLTISAIFGLNRDVTVEITATDDSSAEASESILVQVETISGLADRISDQPAVFALSQNYPNPFNPSTTIRYQLADAVDVQLQIYNTLGQTVAVLVSERQSAGEYRVKFDTAAFNLASGVYIYHLRAGNFQQVRKMILLQ